MNDAMTDPRPRVTNKMGNAQQTSVVSAPVSPTRLLTRSVRISPSVSKTNQVVTERRRIRCGEEVEL
jgi:hypothetical protein